MAEQIMVRFDRDGFYHAAYGRLGRGRTAGTIYGLPAAFAEMETIEVDVWHRASRPPRITGHRTITRYKHLPSSAEVIGDDAFAAMTEDALASNEKVPAVVRPKVASPEALAIVTGKKVKVSA